MKTIPIPRYRLYGDIEGDELARADLDFLHIEPIQKRSGAYDWRIQTHAHPHHYQIHHVGTGRGSIDIEGVNLTAHAPCLVSIPCTAIHRIAYLPGTDGSVVTAAMPFVTQACLGDTILIEATRQGGVFPLRDGTGPDPSEVSGFFAAITREFAHPAPGRRAALMAWFTSVLVALMRAEAQASQEESLPAEDRNSAIAMRYRDLVEAHFLDWRRIEAYAEALGVTPARLNAACKARLGTTASGFLHDRIVTEAKRWLIYTGMTVAEIGYALGFEDPAYFSRFFARRTGTAPGRLREEIGQQAAAMAEPPRSG